MKLKLKIKKLIDSYKCLSNAIYIAHGGKHETLDINDWGYCVTWNYLADDGYRDYEKARYLISKHRLLEKILTYIKTI